MHSRGSTARKGERWPNFWGNSAAFLRWRSAGDEVDGVQPRPAGEVHPDPDVLLRQRRRGGPRADSGLVCDAQRRLVGLAPAGADVPGVRPAPGGGHAYRRRAAAGDHRPADAGAVGVLVARPAAPRGLALLDAGLAGGDVRVRAARRGRRRGRAGPGAATSLYP